MIKMNNVILMSLVLFGLKNIFDLIILLGFVDTYDSLVLLLGLILVLLPCLQIYGILKKIKVVWVLSLFQCVLIYFTSQGTFGWLFSYLLKPFALFQPTQSYVVICCISIGEIAKTIWFFKHRKG